MEPKIIFSKKIKNTAYTTTSKKIIVASNLKIILTKRQLEAIILHEKGHLKHKHALKNILRLILIYGFFILPDYEEIEKEADRHVVDHSYGNDLIQALRRIKTMKNNTMCMIRIKSIIKYMKLKRL